MARITTEDCVVHIPNRFDLVMLAAQRAREIGQGSPLTVERDNDKNPVIALREIAGESVTPARLEEGLIGRYQKVVLSDDLEDDGLDLLAETDDFSMPASAPGEPVRLSDEDLDPADEADEAEELAEDMLSIIEDEESSDD